MKTCELMINSKLCLPVNDDMTLIEDQSIAIEKGFIAKIGNSKTLATEFNGRETLDLPNHLIMPGLINCHVDFSAPNASALQSRNGKSSAFSDRKNKPTAYSNENKTINQSDVLAELVKTGTTTFAGMTSNIEELVEQSAQLGLRCQVASFITEESGVEYQQNRSLRQTLELHDKYKNNSLINIAFGLANPTLMNIKFIELLAMYANEIQAPIQGLQATKAKPSSSQNSETVSSLEQHQQCGLLGPNFQSIPLLKFDEEELAILETTGTKIIHCPSLAMANAQSCNSLQEFWDKDFDIGIGTHYTPSNNFKSLLDTAFLAALLSKHQTLNPKTIKAEDLVYALTLGGAKVLGLANEIGSIEVGKKADLVTLNIGNSNRNFSTYSLTDLLFGNSQLQPDHVFVSGNSLL